MFAKELLLFFLFCGVEFTSALSEQREQRSQCRNQTVFCPCKDRRGVSGHVLVVTCSHQKDPKRCPGKAFYSEECGKVPSGPVKEYAKLDGLDTAYIGTTVNITCKIQSFDGVIGYFLKNDIMVMEDDELQKYEYFKPRVIVTPPNYIFHLEIKNVTMEDAGNYTCKASKYGLKSTKTFLLEVEPCPAGFYCPPGGRGRIPCPQGTYQPNISQTSEQACKSCPAGFYCPLGATSLIQCPIGTYQPNIKQTSELDCIVCPVGFYCPPGIASGIPCPQGTYQPNIGQTSEQACQSCPFFTNSSKNPSGIRPNVYEADCPGEDPSITSKVLTTTSQDVTKIAIGMGCAFLIIIVVVSLSLYIAKEKHWLWFSSSRHSHNPECFPCQPMLGKNGDIENAECAEV